MKTEVKCLPQLNAFRDKSIGVLDCMEQAMYIRLFLIWNQLRRPEWFDVSTSQLMRETGLSRPTVITTKKRLLQKGFIKEQGNRQGKITRYHLPPLYDENLSTTSKRDLPVTSKRDLPVGKTGTRDLPELVNDVYTSQRYTENNISTTTSATPTKEVDNPERKKILEMYQNEIRPVISPIELEKLDDDIEHYGADAVKKAIERSVLRNKRSLGYMESILRSWEVNGYDEDTDGRKRNERRTSKRRQSLKDDPRFRSVKDCMRQFGTDPDGPEDDELVPF
jgi:DnaD/phage-associated family protein